MNIVERVYPNFLLHAQATGRWSITDPPLAQLPVDLRGIVRPDPGMVLIGHDWDQIELRLQGSLANDRPLLDAFRNQWDVHTLNCCDVFRLPYPAYRVDPHGSPDDAEWRETLRWNGKDDDRRVFCKRFVYRLIYRGDPKYAGDIPGAKTLGLDGPRLVEASNNWLLPHGAIREYWNRIDAQVKRVGYTETWTGRKRRYMSIGPDRIIPSGVFREAANFPMQGGVADIHNLTIIEVSQTCPYTHYFYSMHDSMWFEVPVEREAEAWVDYKRIVTQPRNICGVMMDFPASFKRVGENGKEEKVK